MFWSGRGGSVMRPNKEGVIFTPVVWQVFQVLSLQELLKYGPAHPLAGVSYTSMSDHSKDFDGVNRAHQHHSLHNGPQDHFHNLRRCKVYQRRASPLGTDVVREGLIPVMLGTGLLSTPTLDPR